MNGKPAHVMRAADISAQREVYTQRMNPRSRIENTELSRPGGLQRVGVSLGWLKPGDESFTFHAHQVEEEWLYLLSGRAVVDMGAQSVEVGPGDFVAFPAPNVPHLVRNPFDAECSYLMGGEIDLPMDVIDYPKVGKRYLLRHEPGQPTSFHALGPAEYPFGLVDEEKPKR